LEKIWSLSLSVYSKRLLNNTIFIALKDFIFPKSGKKLVCLNIRTNYEDPDKPQEQSTASFPGRGTIKKDGCRARV
jgi:hypothetical protein